jgi:hypothetical protein
MHPGRQVRQRTYAAVLAGYLAVLSTLAGYADGDTMRSFLTVLLGLTTGAAALAPAASKKAQ